MKKILLVLFAAIAVMACNKQAAEIKVPATVVIPSNGEVVTFTVDAPVAWKAALSEDVEWLNIAPKSGEAGVTTVRVTAEEFTERDTRTVGVAIVAEGLAPVTVMLVQNGLPAISTETEILVFGADACSQTLTFGANTEYVVEVVDAETTPWLTVAPVEGTKALPEVVYNVTVTANEAYQVHGGERWGKIRISVVGVEEETTEGEEPTGEVVEPIEVDVCQYGVDTEVWSKEATDVVEVVAEIPFGGENFGTVASIAVLGDDLIVCSGDGETPVVLDKATGAKKGLLNIGDKVCYAIANDDAGHLVFCDRNEYVNNAYTTPVLSFYYMTSATSEPVSLGTVNPPYGGIGAAITIRGDVTGKAAIATPTNAFLGISTVNAVTMIQVTDGAIASAKNLSITGVVGLNWAQGTWNFAPNNYPAIALTSNDVETTLGMIGWYDEDMLYTFDSTGAATIISDLQPGGWANNLCTIDVYLKSENAGAMAIGAASFFPQWAASKILLLHGESELYEMGTQVNTDALVSASLDVKVEPAAKGGYNVYYLDLSCNSVGAIWVPSK